MKKRIFACLMVAIMLFGILALPAAAEENQGSAPATQSEGGGDTTGGGTTGGGDTTGGGTTGGGDTTGGGTTGGGDTTGGGTTGGGDTTGGGTTGGGDTTGGGTTGGGDTTGGGTTGGGDTTGGGTTGGGDTTGGGTTGGGDTTGGGTTGGGDTSGGGNTGSGETTTCKHDWLFVEVPPTCTEIGAKGYVCVYCNAVTGEQAIPIAPHTYDNACDPKCNVCEAERTVEHKFSKQWSRNSKNHWHACTVCGEKNDVGNHFAGPAATEDKDQICLTCGIILTRKLEHKHEWAKEWSSDETGHFHKCTDEDCTESDKVVKHVYDDSCDPDCNECGFVTETAHSYDGAWMTDENGHWSVCSVCGNVSDAAEHVSVSAATDTEAELCAVCGYEMAPALVHAHAFGESWSSDDNLHWHACECGEKAEEAPHTWDEGSEQEDGSLVYRCIDCGAQRITEGQAKKASESSSIGLIILLVFLIIALVGAIVALIVVLRMQKKPSGSGKYNR